MALTPQRYELVTQHEIDGYFGKLVLVHGRSLFGRQQVDEWQPVSPGELFGLGNLGRFVVEKLRDLDLWSSNCCGVDGCSLFWHFFIRGVRPGLPRSFG
jgi:hypothetical protein